MRSRRRSLNTWLAIALVLAVAIPVLGAGAAWWAIGARQRADLDHRTAGAAAAIAATAAATRGDGTIDTDLARRLAALDVEAEVHELATAKPTVAGPVLKEVVDGKVLVTGPAEKVQPAMTAGLLALLQREPDGKRALQAHYVQRTVPGAQLFVRRPEEAARITGTGVTALVLLAWVLAGGSALLRRWVVRPLVRLSRDLDQVAGGAIAVAPVSSPAREVSDIGAALHGMAGGLRSALDQRDAADNERRFLIASIAHDLRTPLFTLRGSLEAIEHGIGDGGHLARAQHKATVLDGLIDDLFTFSRLEYAGVDPHLEPLDAVALAREAARAFDSDVVVAAPDDDVVVLADRAGLLRVLMNLLDNAVRHAHARVELAVERNMGDVLFVVTDDGPGLDPDDLPHVFEPLFRSDRTRNTATGGMGLGLAIVDRLATAQGATVTADAGADGGARFTVRCPG